MSERHIVETGIRQFLKADRNMCRIAAVCQQDMNPAIPGGPTAVIQGLTDLLTVVAEAMNFGVDMLEVYRGHRIGSQEGDILIPGKIQVR